MNRVNFLIVGLVVFGCDWLLYSSFIKFELSTEFARFCALVIAVQLTFIGQRLFAVTVQFKNAWQKAWLKHQSASAASMLINYVLFTLCIGLGLPELLCFTAAIAVATVVNYLLALTWVHRN